MERRALLAIALSILVLMVFRYFEDRKMAERQRTRPPAQKTAPAAPPPVSSPEATAPPVRAEAPPAPKSIPSDTAASARRIVVEGDLYRAVVENQGAVLTSWILKKYKSGKGEVFEMVAASHSPESRPYPGSVILDDTSLNWQVNGDFYQVEVEGGKNHSETLTPPVGVTFRLRRGDLNIEKRFWFERENYLVRFSATVERAGRPLAARILLGEDIGPE